MAAGSGRQRTGGSFLLDLGFEVCGQATLGLGLASVIQHAQASFLPTSSYSLKGPTYRVRHSTPGTQSPVTLTSPLTSPLRFSL